MAIQPEHYKSEHPNFSGFHTLYNFRASNTGYGNKERYYDFSNEPTFLTFSIGFDFDEKRNFKEGMTVGDLYWERSIHSISPLLNTEPNSENAYNYLRSRNRFAEAKMLLLLVDKLKEITWNNPWFYQTLSGLPEAWKKNTDMSKPFKANELQLNIETLESLDLSIAYIADLYRKVVYDQTFMREIIPDNLRWFTMYVYVCEFRNIRLNALDNQGKAHHTGRSYLKKGETISNQEVLADQYNWLDAAKTFHKYTFSMCEFDFSETVPYDSLSVGKIPDMASNRFKVNPNWFMEDNSYDLQTLFKNAKFVEFDPENDSKTQQEENAGQVSNDANDGNANQSTVSKTVYYTPNPTRSNKGMIASINNIINGVNASIDDVMNLGMYIADTGNRLQNRVNGVKSAVNTVKSSVQYRVDQAKAIANGIKNLPKTISDIFHNIKDNDSSPSPYSPQHMATHETYNNEFAPINPNATTSDVHEQSFGNNIGNATVSDIKEQIIGDTVGDVTLSDVKEQEFEDRVGDVTLSDVKEQEFEDKDPDAARTDVQPQVFKPKNPNMAISDVKEQEFEDVEPVVTLSDVNEQEFDDKGANVTEAEEHFTDTPSTVGMPTKTDVQENKIKASSRPKPTKPLSASELVETEFGTPGTPTVSIFQKIVEQKNRTLPENVTHSDHNAS